MAYITRVLRINPLNQFSYHFNFAITIGDLHGNITDGDRFFICMVDDGANELTINLNKLLRDHHISDDTTIEDLIANTSYEMLYGYHDSSYHFTGMVSYRDVDDMVSASILGYSTVSNSSIEYYDNPSFPDLLLTATPGLRNCLPVFNGRIVRASPVGDSLVVKKDHITDSQPQYDGVIHFPSTGDISIIPMADAEAAGWKMDVVDPDIKNKRFLLVLGGLLISLDDHVVSYNMISTQLKININWYDTVVGKPFDANDVDNFIIVLPVKNIFKRIVSPIMDKGTIVTIPTTGWESSSSSILTVHVPKRILMKATVLPGQYERYDREDVKTVEVYIRDKTIDDSVLLHQYALAE